MGMPIVNLTGQKFGRLTVLWSAGKTKSGNLRWFCHCACEKTFAVVSSGNLRSGSTHSCGCLKRENLNRFEHGHKRHDYESPTHSSWHATIQRCTNPNATGYERYGGAGVTVCNRWLTFENFLADLGERPDGTTLGRFGDVGNYEPRNAKWMTRTEQETEKKKRRESLRA
jgi:hypothetical protein